MISVLIEIRDNHKILRENPVAEGLPGKVPWKTWLFLIMPNSSPDEGDRKRGMKCILVWKLDKM